MLRNKTAYGLFFVFAFLILAPRLGQALTESERDHLRMLPEWIPYTACQETKVLKQCFLWTRETCEMAAAQSTLSCLNLYEPEWRKPTATDVEFWKSKISECVIRDLRGKNRPLIAESMICRNKGVVK